MYYNTINDDVPIVELSFDEAIVSSLLNVSLVVMSDFVIQGIKVDDKHALNRKFPPQQWLSFHCPGSGADSMRALWP